MFASALVASNGVVTAGTFRKTNSAARQFLAHQDDTKRRTIVDRSGTGALGTTDSVG